MEASNVTPGRPALLRRLTKAKLLAKLDKGTKVTGVWSAALGTWPNDPVWRSTVESAHESRIVFEWGVLRLPSGAKFWETEQGFYIWFWDGHAIAFEWGHK